MLQNACRSKTSQQGQRGATLLTSASPTDYATPTVNAWLYQFSYLAMIVI
jgi:hypothetical protein